MLCVVNAFLFDKADGHFSDEFCPDFIQLIPRAPIIIFQELSLVLCSDDCQIDDFYKELMLLILRFEKSNDRVESIRDANIITLSEWINNKAADEAAIEIEKVRMYY